MDGYVVVSGGMSEGHYDSAGRWIETHKSFERNGLGDIEQVGMTEVVRHGPQYIPPLAEMMIAVLAPDTE